MYMVGAAPNNSIIRGKIKHIKKNSKVFVELTVIDSFNINGLPNFTRNRIGENIELLMDESDVSNLKEGMEVEIYVKYVGDEKGGLFRGRLKS